MSAGAGGGGGKEGYNFGATWGVWVPGEVGGWSFFVTGHKKHEGLKWESANPKNIVTKQGVQGGMSCVRAGAVNSIAFGKSTEQRIYPIYPTHTLNTV